MALALNFLCVVVQACRLVSADASDDKIARKIIEKLAEESVEGVSYAKIARAASMQGRQDLAIRLLDCEPKYSEQVYKSTIHTV